MSGADDARDEIIAALDARTSRHGDQLGALESTVSESADLLAQILPRVDGLATDVAELSGRIGAGPTGGAGKDVSPVLAVRWEMLTADEAAAAWNELGEWVATVLVPWYEISRALLPDCWPMHRPVVRHLSTLHTTYLAAHTGPAASATAAADWHSRWLPNTVDAIHREGQIRFRGSGYGYGAWDDACAPGRHLGCGPDGRPLLNDKGYRVSTTETRDPLPYEDRDSGGVSVADDPAYSKHWAPFFQRAVDEDVTARRATGR